jgi:hypothetical protein
VIKFIKKRKRKMDSVITESKEVTLLEILDRILDKGVVISGDLVISLAEIDLIYVGLKVLISSVETMERLRGAPFAGAMEEPT